jgi:CRP-like cAMP-binding protein
LSKSESGLTVDKVTFEPHEILFEEGDPPTGLFLIEEGTVEVFRRAGARQIILARLSRGDVVGELALIEGIPHTRSVRAVSAVDALKIEPEQLDDALAHSRSLIRLVLKRVVRKLHRTNDRAYGAPAKPQEQKS